jgi:mannose/fructose/N-acetylgalactosamine-specific phosphotransferase system component IID
MFNFLNPEAANPTPQEIARFFRLLGWIGFWLQSLLGFMPILVLVATVLFSPNRSQSGGLSFGLFSAIACLLLMIFSIYWCFRYTQLARKLAVRDLRPAKSEVIRDLQVGLSANIGSMAIAVIIALARVGELTIRMLALPQGSTIVAPIPDRAKTIVGPGALITPSDMIAIQAMVNTIASGLVGVVVALVLLYLVRQNNNPQERS